MTPSVSKSKFSGEIRSLALPAIVTNITTPLLGLVDVAVTGHIGKAQYIAAIAVGGAMFNMLYWVFNFLRMGTTGVTAQAFGTGSDTGVALYRSLGIGALIGLLMLISGDPLAAILIRFVDAEAGSYELAVRYFRICLLGAPAVMCSYALAGWFIGMQDTRSTLLMALVTNLVNIAVSCVLVFCFNMRIEGVAAGTVCGQWAGVLTGGAVVILRHRPGIPPIRILIRTNEILRFFRLNSDIFLRTLCLVAVTVWFTRAGAEQGVDILAANAVLLQLFMLCSYFMDGYAFAAEAMAGKYHGMGDNKAVISLTSKLLRTGGVIALIAAGLYALGGELFINMLTDQRTVRETALHFLPWAVLIPLCGFTGFIMDGVLVGLTRTRLMLIAMAVSASVFFILYFSLRHTMANHGLWLSFNVYLLTRGIIEFSLFRKKEISHQKR